MKSFNPIFKETIELLLAGKVICETSAPESFQYFFAGEHQQEAENYLAQIGRSLLYTKDQKGFYAAINTPNKKDLRAIKERFREVAGNLEGFVVLLRMFKGLSPSSRPITASETIRESTLLDAITDSPSLQDQLDDVIHKLKISQKGVQHKTKLKALLSYLEKHDYLKSWGKSGITYRATANWSLLYDQMEFIQQYEAIPLRDEQANAQTEII